MNLTVLPLFYLREYDSFEYPKTLINLAKLSHLGFPVADAIVVKPPKDQFKNAFFKLGIKSEDELELQIANLKLKLRELEIPSDFQNYKRRLDIKKAWEDLLDEWVEEMRGNIKKELHPKHVILLKDFNAIGTSYFDENSGEVVTEVDGEGLLDAESQIVLENLVREANKKLFIPQKYYWVIDEGQFKFVKILPHTPSLEEVRSQRTEVRIEKKNNGKNRRALKIFQDLEDFEIVETADGCITNVDNLAYGARNFEPKPVFVKVTNSSDLEQLKNTRGETEFLNLEVVLEANNLRELKNDLDNLKKVGQFKTWLLIKNPGSLINLEELLEIKLKGVILDLDSLAEKLGEDNQTLYKFLEEPIKLLHERQLPVIALGDLSRDDEFLNFAIKKGLYGICIGGVYIQALDEHISFLEKLNLKI